MIFAINAINKPTSVHNSPSIYESLIPIITDVVVKMIVGMQNSILSIMSGLLMYKFKSLFIG
ncbi:MAG: hypothetical protein DRP46_01295 [Candidatus Zixiibacteriota bacterium]|nr:MAG: hypothetical protein DRP46_01295 [candidate division Zixibacteria bacterium]